MQTQVGFTPLPRVSEEQTMEECIWNIYAVEILALPGLQPAYGVTRLFTCPLQSSLRHMGFCHSSINLKSHVVKMELVKSPTYNFSSLVPATLWEY